MILLLSLANVFFISEVIFLKGDRGGLGEGVEQTESQYWTASTWKEVPHQLPGEPHTTHHTYLFLLFGGV